MHLRRLDRLPTGQRDIAHWICPAWPTWLWGDQVHLERPWTRSNLRETWQDKSLSDSQLGYCTRSRSYSKEHSWVPERKHWHLWLRAKRQRGCSDRFFEHRSPNLQQGRARRWLQLLRLNKYRFLTLNITQHQNWLMTNLIQLSLITSHKCKINSL